MMPGWAAQGKRAAAPIHHKLSCCKGALSRLIGCCPCARCMHSGGIEAVIAEGGAGFLRAMGQTAHGKGVGHCVGDCATAVHPIGINVL